jgi:GT2 family glycosyltransferase
LSAVQPRVQTQIPRQATPHPGAPPDVSVIIVSFNTRETLRQCLQSVIDDASALTAEIIVVDNASTDGSPDMIEQDFPQVVLLRSAINLGFGEGNNLALRQARGRYFVLLNSDAFVRPGALAVAIRHMDANPAVGLGGCRLIGRDGSSQPSSRCFHSVLNDAIVLTGLAAKFPRSKLFGRFDRTWADENQPASVDWVPGAFSIVRPSALDQVGFFDPNFFLYYEEVDLCRRMKRAGIPIWYWPDIVVVHIGGESSRQHSELEFSPHAAQVTRWRMRSTFLYYRKHHGSKARLAKWMEQTLYGITVLRNLYSRDPRRKGRSRYHRNLLSLINDAWRDTNGGRVSPPRPW